MSVNNILGSDGKILARFLPTGTSNNYVDNPMTEVLAGGGFAMTNVGAIGCASVAATGAVGCASVAATGAVGCASVAATGAVGCASVAATGAVGCASVNASGAVACGSITVAGNAIPLSITAGTNISVTGTASAPVINASFTTAMTNYVNGGIAATGPSTSAFLKFPVSTGIDTFTTVPGGVYCIQGPMQIQADPNGGASYAITVGVDNGSDDVTLVEENSSIYTSPNAKYNVPFYVSATFIAAGTQARVFVTNGAAADPGATTDVSMVKPTFVRIR